MCARRLRLNTGKPRRSGDDVHRCFHARGARPACIDLSAETASPLVAARYTEAIMAYCEGLRIFPYRGNQRDDIRPGLRITHYRKRAVIAFTVDADQVSILGGFYGGQDYEANM